MTLLSTKDDFLQRTLANVPGVLGKLEYLSGLRENGRYVHWGVTRIYSEEAMQRAIAEVHRGVFLEVLRMPLRRLVKDLTSSAAREHTEPKIYLQSLLRRSPTLLPSDIGGGSESHFNSIIAALLALLG